MASREPAFLECQKDKMMIFHSKQNKLSVNEIPIIKINGMPIETVTEFKFLGVLIAQASFGSLLSDK